MTHNWKTFQVRSALQHAKSPLALATYKTYKSFGFENSLQSLQCNAFARGKPLERRNNLVVRRNSVENTPIRGAPKIDAPAS